MTRGGTSSAPTGRRKIPGMTEHARSSALSRRDALRLIGLGAAAAAFPRSTSAAPPTFPKGAVIRTILKDYDPQELASGATLFHEHMSLAPDFLTRWVRHAADTAVANGEAPAGGRGGGGRGGAPPPRAPPRRPLFLPG